MTWPAAGDRQEVPQEEAAASSDAPDPLDRLDAATERAAAVGLLRFARVFHLRSWPVTRFVFPLVFLALGGLVLTVAMGREWLKVWSFVAVYFAPLGIETGIPYGIFVLDLPPVLLVAIVLYVDFFGGLFLVWNLDLLFRVPKLGPWLRRVETKGAARWQRHKWLRDLGVVGLTLFVFLPISGSGAVPGSIIGRLGGFPWPLVWLAIFVGSALRVIGYTLFVTGVIDHFL